MSIVSNASPLIFLSKADQLSLPRALFEGPFLIPAQVRDEVIRSAGPEGEKENLEEELRHWKVREVGVRAPFSGVGSIADWSVFELAMASRPKIVLADDRYLRGILSAANLPVLGTLGLFNLAVAKKILTAKKAAELADLLVDKHRYWIDASTYSKFLKSLKEL